MTFTVKIAGPAGAGIKSSGLLLSEILIRHGLFTADYVEYPSLVRGGHNTYQVTFSDKPVHAAHSQVNLFFSLEPNHWQQHRAEFSNGSLVVGDDAALTVPLKDMAKELGSAVYKNTICLGIAAFILNLDLDLCKQIISGRFGTDSPNNQTFSMGFDFAAKNCTSNRLDHNSYLMPHDSMSLYDGNESFGWGFLHGGGNFYCAYPMSPSSGTLHFLASKESEFKIKVVHPEDEIAAASIAAGAAFAGARSAIGTSGGGFALMTESVSLCGAAELPVVFYLVSRPGPATGLPTWTGQGDLLFAVNSGHGEFNKIVIAPGDQAESYEMGVESLNLAARFGIPVIVLSDKFIAESSASLPKFERNGTETVKWSKPLPGTPGREYMANSYEHDDEGFSVEDSAQVISSVDNRLRQLEEIRKSVKPYELYGNSAAQNLIISFGSTKSTILECFGDEKFADNYAFMQIKTLWPISPDIGKIVSKFKKVVVVENNSMAQLTSLLRSQFWFDPAHIFLKYDGRPFFPEELTKLLIES